MKRCSVTWVRWERPVHRGLKSGRKVNSARMRVGVQRGLLKGEQLNALARHVYYGGQGQTDGRDLQQQMSRASCLVLILAALIYWQILHIDGVLQHWDPTEDGIDPALLTHINPIGWDNVVLYGEYHLDRSLVRHPPSMKERSAEHYAITVGCD